MAMDWTDRVGRRIKLRDLHILLAVTQFGSMGRASSELGISQPVISKAIADLEHALRIKILDRSPQGVEPTMYGRALIRCGMAVFDDLRRGVKEVEFLSDPTAGELRIGCTEPLAAGLVSAVVGRLSEKYPRAEFHVVPGDTLSLQNRELRQHNIELAIVPTTGLAPERDVSIETIFDDFHVIMAGNESKWTRRRKIKLANLLNETWILPPPNTTSGDYVAETFRHAGCEPPRAHVVSFSIPLHQHMLATGRFVTSLPRSLLQFAKHLPLARLSVDMPALPRPVGIMTLTNRALSPLAQLFVDHVRAEVKALRASSLM
jgi:DNA-binding transcriptional LysR family regulator